VITVRTLGVEDPATGRVFAEVPDADAADGLRALDDAAAVQHTWSGTPPRERGEILRRAYELVTSRGEEIARLITTEMGKPFAESRAEVAYGAEFLRWFGEEAVRIGGRYTPSPTGTGRILVSKQAVGPTLAITPWNFPLAMGTRKIAPALAAGCTVIVKPAAETPLTMLLLADVLAEAGVPAGVVAVLPTSRPAELTAALLADRRLRKLTFTGSTAVGAQLLAACAPRVLRTSMELGGNAPFLVFADADLDAAVDGLMAAKMRNGGQACTAANRVYVDNAVLGEFTAALTERVRRLRLGPGTDPDATVGPLITEKQRHRVTALVDEAVADGAQVATGGGTPHGPGWFHEPTVLTGVAATSRVLREEIFGPVAAISGFDDEAEAVASANDTEYGLAAYVYTTDIGRALRMADAIESGMVGINRGVVSDVAAPFGGVKESGLGREAGSEGIEEYLETKYVALP
jgi:succinate-semialdehyde dehydrogenase / glutarate-semialdehyde dehydrogenase